MARTSAVILDHQIHLLDAFTPQDGLVLPPGIHGHVLPIYAFLAIEHGAGAAVAVALAAIWDVAERPDSGLSARGFFDNLGADMDGSVAVVHRRSPIARALRV